MQQDRFPDLVARAGRLGARLRERGETVAVAESSTGGLIAAALLAQAGASAYFLGGGVIYTAAARSALLGLSATDLEGMRPSSEAYARLLAERARGRLGADWGLGETGAAGPEGNRYGDPPGHCCLAIAGPVDLVRTIGTGGGNRLANMQAFAAAALDLLGEAIGAPGC
ncbi:CinA family protein [Roseomonas nepalensis]|uniref:CinA family protein n=1 Tax=Muricoccus nepalensis TaxID=1854500 RepID=A0A502FY37_9PROT|nr:CinA family protein [Roseomonas nepalensis]TPG53853.1 CinA family protein [Roseomonas nepalensis]